MFCPKTTKFGPKLAFLVNLGQAMQACSVPCWWVGWWLCCTGCISQDTYLLYHIIIKCDNDKGGLKCWKEMKKRISCNFQRCPWQVPRIRGDSRGEAQFFNPSPTFLTQPDSCQLKVVVLIFCSFQPTSPRKIIGL